MIKKFLRWSLAATLVAGLALTSLAPQPAISSEEKVMDLSLEQAVALAEKNSPDIKLAELAKAKKSISLSEADDAARSVRQKVRNHESLSMSDYTARDVTAVIAKRSYDDAQLDYDLAVKSVKLGVTSAYYNLLSARTTLTNKQESAARSREALQMVEAKYKVGSAAKLEVDQQRVTVATDEAAVAQAEQSLKEAQLAFNEVLALPIGQQVNATSAIKLLEYKVDYDASLATALKEDAALRTADLSMYQAQLTKEVIERFYPGTYEYQSVVNAYESTKVSYEKTKYDVNSRVLTAYNSLQNAKRQYDILASQVKVAEDSARLTKLRYQVGMATLYDVNTASTQLEQVKQQYQSAIFAYNLAVSKFQNGIF